VGTASGEIGGTEFYIRNNYACITSEQKVSQALAGEGLIDNFMEFAVNESYPTLGRYLNTLTRKQRASIENTINVRKVPLMAQDDRIARIRPQIVSPLDGSPYIPGSSIKGALRTAVLFLLLQDDKKELDEMVKRLPRARKKDKQWFARELDRQLLQQVNLGGVKKGPNTDWLRSLHIGDAFPEKKDCTEIIPVKVVSLTDHGYHFGARDATIYVEAIVPGTTLTCELVVDNFSESMLTRFNNGRKIIDFKDLLEKLPEKFTQIINTDRKFYELAGLNKMVEYHDLLIKYGANFRFGWGSGLLTTTVDLLLNEEERREVRQVFYPHRNNPNFPQSRKVTVERNNVVNTLGWVRLSWEKTG
jgi:CRISPR-associated protein Csm5